MFLLRNQQTKCCQFTESPGLVGVKPEVQVSSSFSTTTSSAPDLSSASPVSSTVSPGGLDQEPPVSGPGKGKRGRPRKHAPKLPLPPLYVFIRNLLHNPGYNPSVIAWVDQIGGCFKVRKFIIVVSKTIKKQDVRLF